MRSIKWLLLIVTCVAFLGGMFRLAGADSLDDSLLCLLGCSPEIQDVASCVQELCVSPCQGENFSVGCLTECSVASCPKEFTDLTLCLVVNECLEDLG
jgi:hypothetical protein